MEANFSLPCGLEFPPILFGEDHEDLCSRNSFSFRSQIFYVLQTELCYSVLL